MDGTREAQEKEHHGLCLGRSHHHHDWIGEEKRDRLTQNNHKIKESHTCGRRQAVAVGGREMHAAVINPEAIPPWPSIAHEASESN
jgi:hypothetical protein